MKVDAEKTRQYYRGIGPGALCSCNDCKNYYARVKAAYPAAAEYLAGVGAEIEKPLEPGADGMMEYCACQYVVLGYVVLAAARKTTVIQLAGWKCARQGFTPKRV